MSGAPALALFRSYFLASKFPHFLSVGTCSIVLRRVSVPWRPEPNGFFAKATTDSADFDPRAFVWTDRFHSIVLVGRILSP